MTKIVITALTAFLLGAAASYFALTQVIALQGGSAMFGLVDDIKQIRSDNDLVDIMACMALLKANNGKVDHLALNQQLNDQLKPFDNGTSKAFNLLLFTKGYGMGKGDQLASQGATGHSLNCQQRYPDIYPN